MFWGIYDVLQPSSGRPEFPSDERKEEACRFSLALKVWITSVAEQPHTHTHTHTEGSTHSSVYGTLDLSLHVLGFFFI